MRLAVESKLSDETARTSAVGEKGCIVQLQQTVGASGTETRVGRTEPDSRSQLPFAAWQAPAGWCSFSQIQLQFHVQSASLVGHSISASLAFLITGGL